MVVGLEHGDIYQLPYSRGALEQPYKTMLVWSICRSAWVEVISKKQKEALDKNKKPNNRRR